ncbi:MAG: ABC transporter permease [Ignavibacteriaceae bacterium]|nr:ABC transporter permease [Ignavibacteriaceae bacterium]
MKTILKIVRKEFQQFRRDPKMFGIILIAPVVQLILLGYAATLDVNSVHTIIYDQDKSSSSRKLIEKFESSGFFSIDYYAENYAQLTKQLDNGNALFALVIPHNFEKGIERKETVYLQAIFDASDGNTASIASGYVIQIISKYSQNLLLSSMDRTGNKIIPAGQIVAEPRVWYNPNLKTRNFMVPGIVGLLLSIITLLLTSLAVVKEKEIGTLEQLIVTPIKPYQLILGKLIPFVLLGFVAIIIVIAAMWVVFSIEVRGSLVFLFACSFLYILSTLGLGLFVSTISKTQQQAMMIAIFVILMPMVYLSGFAFPIENMPAVIQFVSYAVPLRYFINIVRGVILKGIGFNELWLDGVVLFFIGVFILFLSSRRFQKRLE